MTDEVVDTIWREMFSGDCFSDENIKKAINKAYALDGLENILRPLE